MIEPRTGPQRNLWLLPIFRSLFDTTNPVANNHYNTPGDNPNTFTARIRPNTQIRSITWIISAKNSLFVTICHTIYSRFFDAPSDYISSFPSLVQNLDTCPNIDEHFGNLISLPTPIFPHLAAMRLRKADSRFSESLPRPYTSLQTIYDKANTVKTGPLKFHSAGGQSRAS